MAPLLSVITAVYNDEKYIAQSIQSVLDQTFRDFEYIIVNDGSTDGTLAILEGFQNLDNRIKVISQRNSGAASARNKALSTSTGKYIALQDSDDISLPERFEKQIAQLAEKDDLTISCTNFIIIGKDNEFIARNEKNYADLNLNLLRGSFCVCHPSIMLTKSELQKINGYNPFYEKAEDYDVIYRLLENNCRFLKLNECLYTLRIRESSEGSKNNGVFATRVFENHLNRIEGKAENYEKIRNDNKTVSNHYIIRTANELFFAEDYIGFLKFYISNARKLPFIPFYKYVVFSILPTPIKDFAKRLKKRTASSTIQRGA